MASDLSIEWLESFEAQKVWFERVADGSRTGELSLNMRKTYGSAMRQLIRFLRAGGDVEANPDSLLEWGKSADPGDIMKMLKSFSLWLQGEDVEGYEKRISIKKGKHLSSRSADGLAHGAVRGFFTHNRIWLPKVGKKDNGRAETKKNDANFSVFRIDPNNPALTIKDYGQFRIFLGNLNSFRDQTIALCLLSTSQDIGDLLNLNIGFVRSQEKRERIFWEGVRGKTGEEFRTFFSKEATQYLRQYIVQERDGAGDKDSIFVTRTKYNEEGVSSEPTTTPKNVSMSFLSSARKMGVTNGDTQSPFRPKRMRSIFASACYQVKLDDGLRHIFMGHKGTISENYREMPRVNLEQAYVKVEPFLSVFDEDKSQQLELTRQKSEKALDLALDIREENKMLKLELDEIKSELESQKNMLQMVIDKIVWFEGEDQVVPKDAKPITPEEKDAWRRRGK